MWRRIRMPTSLKHVGLRAASFFKMLSQDDESKLTMLLYREHYCPPDKQQDGDSVDKQGWQTARTELGWITEWAANSNPENLDQQKRAVQMAVLERVDLHKPLSYIIGTQPFLSYEIKCESPVLIPRTETEEWAYWIVRKFLHKCDKPTSILDMCCGSGCIGIALAMHNAQSSVVAADIDPKAVKLTDENRRMHGIDDDHFRVFQSDMFAGLPPDAAEKGFDLIVSNPPYILEEQFETLPRSVKDWESKLALVTDGKRRQPSLDYYKELCNTGCKYAKRLRDLPPECREMPHIVVEVGLQAEAVAALFDESKKWNDVCLFQDAFKQPRWVTAVLR